MPTLQRPDDVTVDLGSSFACLVMGALATVSAVTGVRLRREVRAGDALSRTLAVKEALLLASERRFQSMADKLPVLVGYVDATETYRFTNAQYGLFFETEPDALLGKTMHDVLGSQYAPVKPMIDAALTGHAQTFERHQHRGGRTTHVIVHYVPDVGPEHTVVGIYIMVLDITDRKNAELQQLVNERRLKAITDNVPAIVAHLDRDRRYITCNEQFRRTFGLDPDALVGKTFREVRGEAVYGQLEVHMDAVLEGNTRHFEVTDDIDGIRHHFQHSFVPDLDSHGAVQGFYSVAFDVTDLRRSEELLIESSARQRQILEEQSELVSLTRDDGELIYMNGAFSRQFGLRAANLVGKRLVDLLVPADRAAAQSAVDSVFATGIASSVDTRVLNAGGKELWVAWAHTLQRDAHGGILLRSVGRDITTQRQAELSLQASQNFLFRTGRMAGVGGWELDLERGTLDWSAEVRRIHEVPDDYVPTVDTAIHFYAPEARPVIQAAVERSIAGGDTWDLELRLVTATGRHIWVRAVGDAEFAHGKAVRLLGAFQDITVRKTAQQALEQKEQMLRAITDNLPVFILYVDDRETVRFLNATAEEWLGVERHAAIDRPLCDVLGMERYDAHRSQLARALRGERLQFEVQARVLGRTVHFEQHYNPEFRADGSVTGIYAMVTDITAAKKAQCRLEELARVDTLTGLPNRRHFDEKLEEALRRSQRSPLHLAVMYLDIDHFKHINDSLGHAGGDAVLKEFGARLKACVRETDLAARLAGDEFVVLLEGLNIEDDATVVAEKIVNAMRLEFDVAGTVLSVTTSLGIGFSSDAATTASELMACADNALYDAKRAGRDGFRLSSFGATLLAAA